MGLLWTGKSLEFKSPLRVVARFLFRSRETKAQKCRNLKQQLDDAKQTIAGESKVSPITLPDAPTARDTGGASGDWPLRR